MLGLYRNLESCPAHSFIDTEELVYADAYPESKKPQVGVIFHYPRFEVRCEKVMNEEWVAVAQQLVEEGFLKLGHSAPGSKGFTYLNPAKILFVQTEKGKKGSVDVTFYLDTQQERDTKEYFFGLSLDSWAEISKAIENHHASRVPGRFVGVETEKEQPRGEIPDNQKEQPRGEIPDNRPGILDLEAMSRPDYWVDTPYHVELRDAEI